jgi:hypothetical protein
MAEMLKLYTVTVLTGDHEGAGTDAKVYIQLFGDAGETEPLQLQTPNGDPFERACIDVFTLELQPLGRLARLDIWHDNTGFRPDWFLVKVEVRDNAEDRRWIFPANRWLGKKRRPHSTKASLKVLA